MFICPKDDAVILLSAKARFGPAERNELIRDITCAKRAAAGAVGEAEDGGEGFIINDWLFQTSSQYQGKTLHEIPGFEKYRGKHSFKVWPRRLSSARECWTGTAVVVGVMHRPSP
jgi:hypothetical protein